VLKEIRIKILKRKEGGVHIYVENVIKERRAREKSKKIRN
jgi:hypothetical protein